MYDQEGIAGAKYHNGNQVTEYEYVKDGFNNGVAIVKDNTIVVRYVYDSWGNIIKTLPENVTDLFSKINPIRYRSYYYDIETELYYLQTRYYDPAIGAFISPDSVDYLNEESIGGLNLYTYCYNNPVMYCDPSVHSAIIVGLIIGAIVGAAIGAGLGYVLGATLSFTFPTLGFVNAGGILGIGVTGSMALTIPLGKIIVVGGVYELAKGLTVMAANVGKSGGYRIKHYYPNDYQPAHVHICGDDIKGSHGIRVGLDGKPLKGEHSLSPQAKNAIEKLLEVIEEVLKPWIG